MLDWIKFKVVTGDKTNKVEPVSVRCYDIRRVTKTGTDSCNVYFEEGGFLSVAESYDEVMKKIYETEGPENYPIAEHFTRGEYELILETMERLDNPSKSAQNIINVLKEISKEND